MVGLIHKILFDLILSIGGERALLEIKKMAKIPDDKEFKINQPYSDNEWQSLLTAAMTLLKITPEQAYKAYSEAFYQDALKRFPVWFEMSKNSKEFLARQPAIHNNFASGCSTPTERKKITDKFVVESHKENKLTTFYKSHNKLCQLYIHLAKIIIEHYQDCASIKENKCMHTGASRCEIVVIWSRLGDKQYDSE